MIRAKFELISTTQTKYSKKTENGNWIMIPLTSMKFQVVSGNTPENAAFFASTPSGTIELGVLNPEVTAQFELGAVYYIDFTPAE